MRQERQEAKIAKKTWNADAEFSLIFFFLGALGILAFLARVLILLAIGLSGRTKNILQA